MTDNLLEEIIRFRDERDWRQFHNPKDLAISLSLEAAELLENFQWSSSDEALQNRGGQIREELADVLILCVLMADAMDADLAEIVEAKLKKNAGKYPVEKAFGRKEKYYEL